VYSRTAVPKVVRDADSWSQICAARVAPSGDKSRDFPPEILTLSCCSLLPSWFSPRKLKSRNFHHFISIHFCPQLPPFSRQAFTFFRFPAFFVFSLPPWRLFPPLLPSPFHSIPLCRTRHPRLPIDRIFRAPTTGPKKTSRFHRQEVPTNPSFVASTFRRPSSVAHSPYLVALCTIPPSLQDATKRF